MEHIKQVATIYIKPRQPWYGCAIALAVVGIAFSLLFLGSMVHTRLEVGRETVRAEHLLSLKESLTQNAAQAELLPDIRALDADIRQTRWELLETSRRAGWLLLASVIVALASFKWARHLRRGIPNPLPQTDLGPLQLREAAMTRWAVGGGLVLLAGTAAVFAATERVPLVVSTIPAALPAATAAPAYATPAELAANWHRFRGLAGAGVTELTTIPTEWDGASGKGILWKTKVPLGGHNSPVVWKDKVFLSGGSNEALKVFCFDAKDGKLQWTGNVPADAAILSDVEVMEDTGMAACTVATDGARVYAIFATGDLVCFDMAGKRLWHHALGVPESVYGFATSLEVYRDRVRFSSIRPMRMMGSPSWLLMMDRRGRKSGRHRGRSPMAGPLPSSPRWARPIS